MLRLGLLLIGVLLINTGVGSSKPKKPASYLQANSYQQLYNLLRYGERDGKPTSSPRSPVKGMPPVKPKEDLFNDVDYAMDMEYDEDEDHDEDHDEDYDDASEYYGRRSYSLRRRKKPEPYPVNGFCKYEKKEALGSFCRYLSEGEYYDPFNPYCGFIRCKLVDRPKGKRKMTAFRELCRLGTWVSDQDQRMRYGRDRICRVRLALNVTDNDVCMGGSLNMENQLCAPAKRVLQMNDKTVLFKSQ